MSSSSSVPTFVISSFDDKGNTIFPDHWDWSANYNGDSTINYEQITTVVVDNSTGTPVNTTLTWRKTYSYSGGLLVGKTRWIKQ